MVEYLTANPNGCSDRSGRNSGQQIIFWGGSGVFCDWILRVAESESGGAEVVRRDILQGLVLSSGRRPFVFFGDSVAQDVLADPVGTLGRSHNIRWAYAYRDDSLARSLLSLRRARPELAEIAFLPMDLRIDLWTQMFRLVLSGDFVIPGRLLEFEDPPAPADLSDSPESRALTPREREVLALVAEGKRNKTIAYELGLSEHTIKLHLHHVIGKIGVRNRTQAAQWYYTHSQAGSR